MSFQNKVVWITGASSGIGEALAYAFAREGARLVISARRTEELQRVAQQTRLPSNQVFILPLDSEKPELFQPSVRQVVQAFGRIDILILNAGISQRSFVKDTDLSIDRRLMEINYFGVIGLTKAVLPVFLEQHSGHFVVTSSVVGYVGTPMRSAYAASKHALHGFFDSLRAEHWRDNLQVTLVCPGYIKTDISLNAVNEKGEKHNRMDANQARGMLPEVCANRITKAIRRRRQEVYIGGKEIWGIYLKRFFPKLLSRMLRNYNIP
jgi:short-subunit dehydrogenase